MYKVIDNLNKLSSYEDLKEFFKYFEESHKNQLKKLKFKDFEYWYIVRNIIYTRLFEKISFRNNIDYLKLGNFKTSKKFIFKILFSKTWINLFKPCEVISFGTSESRKKIDNNYILKELDFPLSLVEKKLHVELVSEENFYKINSNEKDLKYTVYFFYFNLFIKIFNLFYKFKKFKYFDDSLVSKLINELNLNEKDIKNAIKYNYAQYKVFYIFFKVKKPKYIFVQCSYCQSQIINAAKSLGIKVIEFQHGSFNTLQASNIYTENLMKNYCSDFLFSYGNKEVSMFKKNKILNYDNILPVGNFIVDYYSKNKVKEIDYISNLKSNKKIVIAHIFQGFIVDYTLNFLIKIAKSNQEIVIILIMRHIESVDIESYDFPENIIIDDCNDCYEIILNSDVVSAFASTCIIDALALSKNVIMIDNPYAEDMTFNYFDNGIDNFKFVSSAEEYIVSLSSLINNEMLNIKNCDLVKSDYENNIKNAFKQIGVIK